MHYIDDFVKLESNSNFDFLISNALLLNRNSSIIKFKKLSRIFQIVLKIFTNYTFSWCNCCLSEFFNVILKNYVKEELTNVIMCLIRFMAMICETLSLPYILKLLYITFLEKRREKWCIITCMYMKLCCIFVIPKRAKLDKIKSALNCT